MKLTKYGKNHNNTRIILLVIILILFFGVGYSLLESNLSISANLLVKKYQDPVIGSYSTILKDTYLSDTNRIVTLRLSLNWTDNEDYDENDTALIGEELSFNITAHFEQYIEE